MKKPTLTQTLLASTLTLAFVLAPFAEIAKAELVNEEIQEDMITPEDEVVIVKKKPAKVARAPKRKVIIQEEPAIEPVATVEAEAVARAQVTTSDRKSVGTSLDEGIQSKMDNVRGQFEDALLRTLDKIKITVDDGSSNTSVNAATVEANANNGPVNTTIVQDSIVNAKGAPQAGEAYMSIDNAPVVEEDTQVVVAKVDEEEEELTGRVRVSPILGYTTIGSDIYNIDAEYTAGLEVEADLNNNLSAVLGYSYSQYDIGLKHSGGFYNYYQPFGYLNNNTKTLTYNQNLFEAGLRFYLFPQKSRFRMFVGAGVGYNKGYVNYQKNSFNTFQYNPWQNLEDYEVTSFLGTLSTGAELQIAKSVAVGAVFKYAHILSSNDDTLNNYGFINNGYGISPIADKNIAGGSIAKENFYSILGTVKVSF